jgi:hypothetical protein
VILAVPTPPKSGPRRGLGLRGRIALHAASQPSSSVLARHLAADSGSAWSLGWDFNVRGQRQKFLSECCYLTFVAAPELRRDDLLRLESFLVERLKPIYVGRVRQRSRLC